MLKQDYKEGDMTLKSALALAVKVLNKTMDVSKLSAEKGEQCCYFLKKRLRVQLVVAEVCIHLTNIPVGRIANIQ